jgi:hypothetical protein
VVPFPALFASYSVLARLPANLRIERRAALDALRRTFEGRAEIHGLDPAHGWAALRGWAEMAAAMRAAIEGPRCVVCFPHSTPATSRGGRPGWPRG